jgi:branched-chain amino acid transport system permease protein
MRRLGALGSLGAVVAALCVLPFLVSDYHQLELGQVGFYFIAILGLAILTGYSGQISLGHGAFMAIGAYTTGILVGHHGWNDLATIPLAGLVAGAAGLLFGLPALRLYGAYLSLATFGLAVSLPAVARKFDHFTGGSSGIQLPNVFPSGRWFYEVAWTCAAILLAAAWLILRGRVGRSLRAIRDSQIAAAAMGVDTSRYKTGAFALSALYAGVAGSLLAIASGRVDPGSFPISLSLNLLIGFVIAGVGSFGGIAAGAVVGALFLQYIDQLTTGHLSFLSTQAGPDFVRGLVLIGLMLVLPTGIAGVLRAALRPRLRERTARAEPSS